MGTGCNSFAPAVRRQVQRCLCAGQRSHTTQTWHRQNLSPPLAPGTWTSSGLPRPRPAGRPPTWESRSQQHHAGEPLIRRQPLELSTEALAPVSGSATAAAMAAAIPPQPPRLGTEGRLQHERPRPRQLSFSSGPSSSRAHGPHRPHGVNQIRTFEPCCRGPQAKPSRRLRRQACMLAISLVPVLAECKRRSTT